MLVENLGSEGNRLFCAYCSVGLYLEGKLIKVGDVADTGIFYRVAYVVNGGIDRVGEDSSDRSGNVGAAHLCVELLISLLRYVSSAVIKGELHIESVAITHRCDMVIGVKNIYIGIHLDVSRGYLLRAYYVDDNGLRSVAVKLCDYTLYVEDYLSYVLFYPGNSGEFVKNAVNLDIGYGITGQGAKHNSAKRVAEGGAEAALKGFYDKFTDRSVLAQINCRYIGLLYLNHSKSSSCNYNFKIPAQSKLRLLYAN